MYKQLLFNMIITLPLWASQPDYSEFEVITFPQTPALGEYISPLAIDWDDDGHIDLLIGDLCREGGNDVGRILFYKNSGTNESPQLAAPVILKDDTGEIITTTAS